MMNKQKELNKVAKEVKKTLAEMKVQRKTLKAEKSNPANKESMNFGMEFTPSKIQTEFKTYFQSLPGKNGSSKCSGADIIGIVSTGSGSIGGTILNINGVQGPINVAPLSPNFVGTRLYLEALRYEKYKFQKFNFVFLPDTGTNTNGSIILAFDPDPADNFINNNPTAPQSLQSIQTMMGFQDSIKSSVWTPFQLKCKTVKNDPQCFWFTNYVGGDIRLSSAGSLFAMNGSSLPSSTSLGTIGIEYEIEFWDSSLDQLNSQCNYSKTANASSLTANQGLNGMQGATQTFTGGGKQLYPIQVDSAGNTYVSIPPGTHLLEYDGTCNSGGTPTAPVMSFSFFDNIAQGISTAFTTLQSLSSGVSTNSEARLKGQIVVPPGGTKMYSTINPAFTGTTINTLLNLAQWAAAVIL